MKNAYEIRGDVVVIFLRRRDGSFLETLIDESDLALADSFPGSWYAHWSANNKSFYVMGNLRVSDSRRTSVLLHRWLLNPQDDLFVDHEDHKTLNNRRSNLREATLAQNNQNVSPSKKRLMVRGVYWSKAHSRWRANSRKNGRRVHLGLFSDLEEAAKVVSTFRQENMPYSATDQPGGDAFACRT